MLHERDSVYLGILFERLEVCRAYRPKFGRGKEGIDFQTFRQMYSEDVFYTWFGLDNALIYSAHKAAGGITSVYRQIGLGSEELIRRILMDELGLTQEQANWSYRTQSSMGRNRTLKLDGRIVPAYIADETKRLKVLRWMERAGQQLSLAATIADAMEGIVLEVRQGYKSKDSKRQNADMANAAAAYTQGYLPVLIVMSGQIDNDIVERYERGKWLVLRGRLVDDAYYSTYAFLRHIVGFDLASFFERNAQVIQNYTHAIIETLLKADGNG